MDDGVIETLEGLDRVIASADEIGVDRGKIISSIKYSMDLSALDGLDPFSDDYVDAISKMFRYLRGESYGVSLESNTFRYSIKEPSPYISHHPHLIGNHIGAIVTLVRDIGKLPPAKVLDMGFGSGDTSLMLARCGFQVDAVDVNATFVEILRHWSGRMHVEDRVNIFNMDYGKIDGLNNEYDVVLFFESFHHSLNHSELVKMLVSKLSPDGVIIFGGEPIHDDFAVPWGLRHQDGLAIYCIRKFGWMELGFQTSYFLELLERNGLYAIHRTYTDYPTANHFRAKRPHGQLPIQSLCIREPYSKGWHPADGAVRWTKGTAGIPFALLGLSRSVRVEVDNFAPFPMKVTLRADDRELASAVVEPAGRAVLSAHHLPSAEALWIDAPTWVPREAGLTSDARTLGIAVRSIHLL